MIFLQSEWSEKQESEQIHWIYSNESRPPERSLIANFRVTVRKDETRQQEEKTQGGRRALKNLVKPRMPGLREIVETNDAKRSEKSQTV
jgi:hypothetical protein